MFYLFQKHKHGCNFWLLSLFLVFFLVIKNLNKYFVPTPAEGREKVNHSHFQWILSVGGGSETLLPATSTNVTCSHKWKNSEHAFQIDRNTWKTTETHEWYCNCGMFINLFYYLFFLAIVWAFISSSRREYNSWKHLHNTNWCVWKEMQNMKFQISIQAYSRKVFV